MKIPGPVKLGVQSLGRENSGLAMKKAVSKRGVTDAAVDTLTGVADTVNKDIIIPAYNREAASQYAVGEADRLTVMTETESILNNPTGMVRADEIPDDINYRQYDEDAEGNTIERELIPTHEVAKEWYSKRLKTSQAAAISNMTNEHAVRKMKLDYGKSFTDNYANVLLQSQKRKQEFELSDLEMSAEKFVEGGQQAKAEQLWLGAIKTGLIGPKAGTEKLMAIPGDIDAYKVSKKIHTSTLAELDNLEAYIYRDYNTDADGLPILNEDGTEQQNPMSFEQRKTAIGELEGRRKSLLAANKLSKTDDSERTRNQHLIDLQDLDEPLDADQLMMMAPGMEAGDHLTVIVANRALHKTKTERSDPATFGGIQMAINDLQIPTKFSLPERRAALITQINDALDAEELTGDDAWKLIERINATEERDFDTPDMELATDQIYKLLTRGSKSSIGLNVDAQSVINAAAAERELFEAARAAGPGFDALAWLDANMGKYVTRNAIKNEKKLDSSLAKPYLVKDASGKFDPEASRDKVFEALKNETIQDDIALEAIRRIREREERMEQSKRDAANRDNAGWSWPWE